MAGRIWSRLLPVLQLTRMALVFTAIADAQATLFLWAGRARTLAHATGSIKPWIAPERMVAMAIVSIGLYGFGMSLNDIIDRRRDRQMAAHRPLPSGRIQPLTAMVICGLLGVAAVLAGLFLTRLSPDGWFGFLLLVWTLVLITFYDAAGKYLVAPGLLALGMIRFFHAAIISPHLPVLWHPLLLLNHVVIVSTICYCWEQKRPAFTALHGWTVIGGLGLLDLLTVGVVYWRLTRFPGQFEQLGVDRRLLWPAVAVVAFGLIGLWIARRQVSSALAGQRLMLAGLLWLIVYDAAFVGGYVGWGPGVCLLALLPVAWISVQVMRWWAGLVAASYRPTFQRAR